jgi:hypothetical protein
MWGMGFLFDGGVGSFAAIYIDRDPPPVPQYPLLPCILCVNPISYAHLYALLIAHAVS